MAQRKEHAPYTAIKTPDADGLCKAPEKMECCGSFSGYHSPDCSEYNRRMKETLNLLQSLSKRPSDGKVRHPEDHREPTSPG